MGANEKHVTKGDGSETPTVDAHNHLQQLTRRSTRASKRRQQVAEAQQDHKSALASSSAPGSIGVLELDDLDLDDDPKAIDGVAALMPHTHGDTAENEAALVAAESDGPEGGDREQAQTGYLADKSSSHNGPKHNLASEPAMKKAKTLAKHDKGPLARRKNRSKWDNPLEMLTNQNSPLGKAELRDLLCIPRAWDVLSEDEKKEVLAEFPSEADIIDAGTDHARPNIVALRNNDNFRHDVSRYQENLREGRHDPEWISQAQAAHRKRALGFYDDFLASKFEEDWGMPMPNVGVLETEIDGSRSRGLSSARTSKLSVSEEKANLPDGSSLQLHPPTVNGHPEHEMSGHESAGAHDKSHLTVAE